MTDLRVCKHFGVNPSIDVCSLCGEDAGVAMLGELTEKRFKEITGREPSSWEVKEGRCKAPHKISTSFRPCDKCVEHMKTGVFIIAASGGEGRPVRTGSLVCIKEEPFKRLMNDIGADQEYVDSGLDKRMLYLDEKVFDAIFSNTQQE